MSSAPEIVTRAEQPYVAIRGQVSMNEIGPFAVRTGEVFAWLGARDLDPAGAPFLKYNVIDMMAQLELDNGTGRGSRRGRRELAEGVAHIEFETNDAALDQRRDVRDSVLTE